MSTTTPCQQCGFPVAMVGTQSKCPNCSCEVKFSSALYDAAALQSTESFLAPTVDHVVADVVDRGQSYDLPQIGSRFGNYLLHRHLGQGGMGSVFEAEQVASGRRVALKLIKAPKLSPELRDRFLQEGRLAASINHPNSVYVFGTEEIDEIPVIAMELAGQESLQQYVVDTGPRPIAEAVDIILQVIAGLTAADERHVLHRDIKPQNCFRDADGTVKVGDYGLALTFAKESRKIHEPDRAGTPLYQSPEQWSDQPLDVRSDIYAVGLTLYFLLTGRVPFDRRTDQPFKSRVLTETPPSIRELRSDASPDLAKVIARCLEKLPERRYPNYQQLADALRPFSSSASQPAPLLVRGLAGVVDQLAIIAVAAFQSLLLFACGIDPGQFWTSHPWLVILNSLLDVAYFAVPEGLWRASLGKWLCGIHVVREQQHRPGMYRALIRAGVFVVVPSIPIWFQHIYLFYAPSEEAAVLPALLGLMSFMIAALLFSSMRRRNGFATWCDLLSGTRVEVCPPARSRPVIQSAEDIPIAPQHRIGPYLAACPLNSIDEHAWIIGRDDVLRRDVWIRRVPVGMPHLSRATCRVARLGRVRWLAGRRSAAENWDAFERIPGTPLTAILDTPRPWSVVRFWLFDIATELAAGVKDRTLPAQLSLDRVWIGCDGIARLVDAPAPRASSLASDPPVDTANCDNRTLSLFLHQLVLSTLTGRGYSAHEAASTAIQQRLPLHALPVTQDLPSGPAPRWVAATTQALLTKPTEVTRPRRLAMLLGCLLLPLISAVSVLMFYMALSTWERQFPQLDELAVCLNAYEPGNNSPKVVTSAADRAALEDYIVGRFGASIRDPQIWYSPYAIWKIPQPQRSAAERLAKSREQPTPEMLQAAEQRVRELLPPQSPRPSNRQTLVIATQLLFSVLTFFVAIPSLLWATIFRVGPLQLIFGVGFVTASGRPASRLRLLSRSLLAWSPVLLGLAGIFSLQPAISAEATSLSILGICLALTLISLALPTRGLPERLARVWLVPR